MSNQKAADVFKVLDRIFDQSEQMDKDLQQLRQMMNDLSLAHEHSQMLIHLQHFISELMDCLPGLQMEAESEPNVCEMMTRHQNAINLIQNTDHAELIKQAFVNSGEMSTFNSIEIGETEIQFQQNGRIVLTFADVSIDSVFDNQSMSEDFDSLSIIIDDTDIHLAC